MTDRIHSDCLGPKSAARSSAVWAVCVSSGSSAKTLPLGSSKRAQQMQVKSVTPNYAATEQMLVSLLEELKDVDFVSSLLQDASRRHWLLQAWTAEAIYGLAYCPYDRPADRKAISRALRRIKGWSFALSLDLLQELSRHELPALLAISTMSRLLYVGYRHPVPAVAESSTGQEEGLGSILIAPKIRQAAKMDRRVYVCGFDQAPHLRTYLRSALANCVRWPALQEPAAAQIGLMVRAIAEKKASCVILDGRIHPLALNRLEMACELSRVPRVILAETSVQGLGGSLLELEGRI